MPERVKTTRMIAVLLELSGVDAPHVAPYPDPINPLHTPAPPGAHLAGICLWVWDVGGWLVHVGAGTAMARPVLVRFERHFCWLLLLIFELSCGVPLAWCHPSRAKSCRFRFRVSRPWYGSLDAAAATAPPMPIRCRGCCGCRDGSRRPG